MHRPLRRLATFIAFAGLALVACSTAATPAPPAGATPAGGGAGGIQLATANSGTLGTYLTGAGGKTLYILTKDSANTSTCSGGCATNWPPLTVPAGQTATAGAGIVGSLGTLTRADGTTQVTHNGAPLYYFAGDSAAGDTNGQGSNGVWFVAPATSAVTPAAASPSAASPSASAKPGY